MTGKEQKMINALCDEAWEKAMSEIDHKEGKRLRSCTAWVYTTENYYILRSYNIYIACIDRNTDTLYDVLRGVYGYTRTSGQHIAKFARDYGQGTWGCGTRYTWRVA